MLTKMEIAVHKNDHFRHSVSTETCCIQISVVNRLNRSLLFSGTLSTHYISALMLTPAP